MLHGLPSISSILNTCFFFLGLCELWNINSSCNYFYQEKLLLCGLAVTRGCVEWLGWESTESVLCKLSFLFDWLIKLGFQIPRQKPFRCTLYFNVMFLFLCPRRLGLVFRFVHSKTEKREYKDESVWPQVVPFQATHCKQHYVKN